MDCFQKKNEITSLHIILSGSLDSCSVLMVKMKENLESLTPSGSKLGRALFQSTGSIHDNDRFDNNALRENNKNKDNS